MPLLTSWCGVQSPSPTTLSVPSLPQGTVYNYILLLRSAIRCLTYLASRRFKASVFDCSGFLTCASSWKKMLDHWTNSWNILQSMVLEVVQCVLYLVSTVHVLRLRWPVCPLWMQFDTEMAHGSKAYEWIRDLHTVTACHSLNAYQKTELFLVQCMSHPHVEVDLTAQVQEQCYHTEIRSS